MLALKTCCWQQFYIFKFIINRKPPSLLFSLTRPPSVKNSSPSRFALRWYVFTRMVWWLRTGTGVVFLFYEWILTLCACSHCPALLYMSMASFVLSAFTKNRSATWNHDKRKKSCFMKIILIYRWGIMRYNHKDLTQKLQWLSTIITFSEKYYLPVSYTHMGKSLWNC